MSREIDTRLIEMEFDNKEFERRIGKTINSLNELENSMNFDGSVKNLKKLDKAANNVDMGGMLTAVESVGKKFSALEIAAISVINNIATSAYNAGVRIVKSLTVDNVAAGWAKMDTINASLATIVATTKEIGESSADAEARVLPFMEKLAWFADETSYSLTDMTENIGKFTAQGIDLSTATDAMMGISVWAATAGQNAGAASRAMYNLSQALSSGYVGLRDWMSIENANMATKEAKELFIETAAAMGELYKASDGKYYAKSQADLIEDLITDDEVEALEQYEVTYKNFRQTLNQKWFTDDVLTESLGEYSKGVQLVYEKVQEAKANGEEAWASDILDELLESGEIDEKYIEWFKQAQQTKSFQEAISYTQDAVSTQWQQVFTALFGSYVKATEFWSDIADRLYDVFIKPIVEIKDSIVEWSELTMDESGNNDFVNILRNFWDAVDSWIEPFRKAWEIIFPSKYMDENGVAHSVFARNLANITSAIKKFSEKLILSEEKIENIGIVISQILKIFRPIKSLLTGLWNVTLKPIITVLSGRVKSGSFLDRISKIVDFVLKKSDKLNTKIQNFFAILTKGIGLGTDAIEKGANIFKGLSISAGSIFTDILYKMFDSIDKITGKSEAAERVDKVKKLFQNLKDAFAKGWQSILDINVSESKKLSDVFAGIKTSVNTNGIIITLFSGIGAIINAIAEWLAKDETQEKIMKFMENFTIFWSGFIDFMVTAWEKIKAAAIWIWNASKEVGKFSWNTLTVFFGDDPANTAALLAKIAIIIATCILIKESFGIWADILESLSFGIERTLRAYRRSKLVKNIRTIAVSFALIAASLALLANLDSSGLNKAYEVLAGFFIIVVTILTLVNKMSVTMEKLEKTQTLTDKSGTLTETIKQTNSSLMEMAGLILSMGVAIWLFAKSMQMIAIMDYEKNDRIYHYFAMVAIVLMIIELGVITLGGLLSKVEGKDISNFRASSDNFIKAMKGISRFIFLISLSIAMLVGVIIIALKNYQYDATKEGLSNPFNMFLVMLSAIVGSVALIILMAGLFSKLNTGKGYVKHIRDLLTSIGLIAAVLVGGMVLITKYLNENSVENTTNTLFMVSGYLFVAVALLGLISAALIAAMSRIEENNSKVQNKRKSSIADFAVMLVGFLVAFNVVAKAAAKFNAQGPQALLGILAVLPIMLYLLVFTRDILGSLNNDTNEKRVKGVVTTLLSLSAVFLALATVIAATSTLSNPLDSIIALSILMFVLLRGLQGIFTKFSNATWLSAKDPKLLIGVIMSVAALVASLGIAFNLMDGIDIPKMLLNIVIIGSMIAGIFGLVLLFAKFRTKIKSKDKDIEKTGTIVASIAAVIFALGLALSAMGKNNASWKTATALMLGIAGAFTGLALGLRVLKPMIDTLNKFNAALRSFANSCLYIGLGIGVAAAGIALLLSTFTQLESINEADLEASGDKISKIFDTIIKALLVALGNNVGNAITSIVTGISNMLATIQSDELIGLIDGIIDSITTILSYLTSGEYKQKFDKIVEMLVDFLGDGLVIIIDKLADWVTQHSEDISVSLEKLVGSLLSVVGQIVGLNGFVNDMIEANNQGDSAFTRFVDNLFGGGLAKLDIIRSKIILTMEQIKQALGGMSDSEIEQSNRKIFKNIDNLRKHGVDYSEISEFAGNNAALAYIMNGENLNFINNSDNWKAATDAINKDYTSDWQKYIEEYYPDLAKKMKNNEIAGLIAGLLGGNLFGVGTLFNELSGNAKDAAYGRFIADVNSGEYFNKISESSSDTSKKVQDDFAKMGEIINNFKETDFDKTIKVSIVVDNDDLNYIYAGNTGALIDPSSFVFTDKNTGSSLRWKSFGAGGTQYAEPSKAQEHNPDGGNKTVNVNVYGTDAEEVSNKVTGRVTREIQQEASAFTGYSRRF